MKLWFRVLAHRDKKVGHWGLNVSSYSGAWNDTVWGSLATENAWMNRLNDKLSFIIWRVKLSSWTSFLNFYDFQCCLDVEKCQKGNQGFQTMAGKKERNYTTVKHDDLPQFSKRLSFSKMDLFKRQRVHFRFIRTKDLFWKLCFFFIKREVANLLKTDPT